MYITDLPQCGGVMIDNENNDIKVAQKKKKKGKSGEKLQPVQQKNTVAFIKHLCYSEFHVGFLCYMGFLSVLQFLLTTQNKTKTCR